MARHRPLEMANEDDPMSCFHDMTIGKPPDGIPILRWHVRFSQFTNVFAVVRGETAGRAGEPSASVKGLQILHAFRNVVLVDSRDKPVPEAELDAVLLARLVVGLRNAAEEDNHVARLLAAYLLDGKSMVDAVAEEDPTKDLARGSRTFEDWVWWWGLATPRDFPKRSAPQLLKVVRHLDDALRTPTPVVAAPTIDASTAEWVHASASEDLPSELIGPFVGRKLELMERPKVWDVVAEGGASGVVLISGEAGIGKTELAREFTTPLRSSADVVVIRLSTVGHQALAGVAELGRQLLRRGGRRSIDALAEAEQSALGRLLPKELGGDEGRSANPAGDRQSLCDAIGALLERAAALRPVVLVLDDLHEASSDTWEVVRALIGRRVPKTLLIATFRPEDADESAVDELVRAARRVTVSRHFELGMLTERELVDLAAKVQGAEGAGQALFAKTGGHPFYATSEIQAVLDRGGQLPIRRLDGGDIPKAIRRHVRRRLDRLSPGARRVLGVASVYGLEMSVDLLARLMGKADVKEIIGHLVELEEARFVASRDEGSTVQITHEYNRDVAYDQTLEPIERARLHLVVVDLIDELDPPDRIALEARHCYMAARTKPDLQARSARASRAAAVDAVERLAHDAAVTHYRRALEHADAAEDRAELLADLGDALWRLGHTPEAYVELFEAMSLARELDQAVLMGRIATTLSAFAQQNDVDQDLRGLYQEVYERLPESEYHYRIRMAWAIVRTTSQLVAPHVLPEIAESTVDRAAASPDPATRAFGHAIEIEVHQGELTASRRAEVADQMAAAAEQARDPHLLSAAHGHRLYAALEQLDPVGVEEAIQAVLEVVARLHYPYARWDAASYRAGLALVRQPLPTASKAIDTAFEIGTELAFGAVELRRDIQRAFLQRELGGIESCEDLVRWGATETDVVAWKAGLACGLCEAVDADKRAEAPEWLERVEVVGLDRLPRNGSYPLALAFLAEAYAYLRDQQRASALLPLVEACQRHPVIAGSTLYWGSMDYHAGLLHATLGHYAPALDCLATAVRLDLHMSASLWVCHTLVARSQILRLRGGPNDELEAERDEARARRMIAEFGYRRIEQELDGERPAHIGPNDGW